jgi:anti-anti-sigma factor
MLRAFRCNPVLRRIVGFRLLLIDQTKAFRKVYLMLQAPESTENILEFQFAGRLDTAKCNQIEIDIRASLLRVDAPVVFDLKRVDYVSSAFLRLCVFAYEQAIEYGFSVINVPPTVEQVFKIAGLNDMIKIE